MHAPLNHWLRLLWGTTPALAFDSECAYIAGGAIHLPSRTHWHHHTAAAAHAAAHLVYSPKRFDGTGLGPIARVLLAVLEDARIEALAVRELPGLARLWRPLHTATPDAGVGFEGLAVRLARSLCDPVYDDPDPWVRKGRDLCFLDPALIIPAMRTPAELRDVATRLGHDIGQMRLPFNSKAVLPLPAYRDDHRWMWSADVLARPTPPASASTRARSGDPPAATPGATLHPEWDRLIARLRPAWCRVIESDVPDRPAFAIADTTLAAARQLAGPVRDITRRAARPGRSDIGESFDLDALVQWQLGRRLRRPAQVRVYQRRRNVAARTALWLLIDQSASTGAGAATGGSALRVAAQSALALGLALQAQGIVFGVAAFNSNGRHAVHWRSVKSFAQPVDEAMVGRMLALQSEGSTRLGAVLRHATQRLAAQRNAQRVVVMLTDGSPHDIDVHDPAYLIDDARHAASSAARHGVRIACIVIEPDDCGDAVRIFGSTGVSRVRGLNDLPGALRRLLA